MADCLPRVALGARRAAKGSCSQKFDASLSWEPPSFRGMRAAKYRGNHLKNLSRLAVALLFFWFYKQYTCTFTVEKSDIVGRFKKENENYPLSYSPF